MQIITSFVYNYTSTQIEDKVIGKYLPQNHLNSEPINTSTNEDKKYLKKNEPQRNNVAPNQKIFHYRDL